MDQFLKYINDKNFIRMALHSGDGHNPDWEKYLREHPESKHHLEQARLIVSQLKSKTDKPFIEKAMELFPGIIRELHRGKQAQQTRRQWLSIGKYAAVAVIFFSIATVLFYDANRSVFPEFDQQIVIDQKLGDSKLLLFNGELIDIAGKKSTINYQGANTVIVNQQDTFRLSDKSKGTVLNQLIVPFGRNSSVVLPDGTVAFLNAGSRLMFPSEFTGKAREVYLTGEAYFKVAHNPGQPFFVKTGNIEVKALGTSFNVSAYTNNQFTEVVLVEGKVLVAENVRAILKKQYELAPGQLASFDRENVRMQVTRVIPDHYVSWHAGYMNLESSELNGIISRLERFYNVRIRFINPPKGRRKLTGKLKLKEECDEVLNVLASTANVQLEKTGENEYVLK
ncbi:MAG: FecR domain-containing protein [Prolixibacteraceae bacterium]|jgi:DNA/RNA endonuclease YhcR with UshA esterase domain|nr:FecR domain-containing protein [Prolixibacteraceae bacterium]